MATFKVTNHKLVSGASDTPVFIHGTYFYFNKSGSSYAEKTNWTNYPTNVGNAVYGDGDLFRSATNGLTENGTPEGGNVHTLLSDNTNVDFFVPNMDQHRAAWASAPRASHTYCNNTNGNGHWNYIPVSNDPPNSASTDASYSSNHQDLFDSTYWKQDRNVYGTKSWHENWIEEVTRTNNNKIFAWFLMNEAYNSTYHREAASNQFSVSGHFDFSTNKEGQDTKPKMISFRGTNLANTGWNNHSNQIDILNGNDYGYNVDESEPTNNWRYPYVTMNMIQWCCSKATNSNQMVIASLPGNVNDNTTYGTSDAKYFFYGSIIEGAGGVLWYMENNSNKYVYTQQTNCYDNFTNNRTFKVSQTSDRSVVNNGSDVGVSWLTNDTWSVPTANLHYPATLNKKFSARIFKHNSRWRVYVVNHFTNSATFKMRIEDCDIFSNQYSNAYDDDGNSNTMSAMASFDQYALSDTLNASTCRIYDIGSGN